MPRGAERDPLSVRFDRVVRAVLIEAVRAYRQGRGVTTWVPSPQAEYRALDAGGRTPTERAFTRSAYYQVTKTGPRIWSLKLTWGKLEAHDHRYGRRCRVRLYRAGGGSKHVSAGRARSWHDHPERQSKLGNRAPSQS